MDKDYGVTKMKKKEIIFLTIIICILAGSIFIKVHKQDDSYAVDAFKENTANIVRQSNTNNFDISPIKNILKENEIIGLGDSTFGIKEFDNIKLNILKAAVEEEGYRILALYVDFGLGDYINDYVHGKEGTSIDKVKGKLSWVLRDKGLLDMIQWVKEYNSGCSEEDQVSIYGINILDMADVPTKLIDYLTKVDNENVNKYNIMIKDIKYGNVAMLTYEEKSEVENNLSKLKDIFEKNKEKYINLSTEKEFNKAYEEITVIDNHISYVFETDFNEKFNIQQRHMGYLISWIKEQEGENKKVLINATNSDVSTISNQIFTMGSSIEEQFEDKYYSIGFDFYKGSCLSYEVSSDGKLISSLKKIEIQEPYPEAIGEKMHNFGIDAGFIDIKGNKTNKKINEVMSRPTYFNGLYNGYTGDIKQTLLRFIPNQNFHGLIFVDNATASEVAK